MRFQLDEDMYVCKECYHTCCTFNGGKTFGVNGKTLDYGGEVTGGYILLKNSEYAPCGKELKLSAICSERGS